MNVKGATKQQIESAAAQVGVNLYNLRPTGATRRAIAASRYGYGPAVDESGDRWAFTLHLGPPTEVYYRGPRGAVKKRAKYTRTTRREFRRADGSMAPNTVPAAVCWHGHRDFMRALLTLAPAATVRTAMATYHGREHFEASYLSTYFDGGERMGVPMVPYGDACRCGDDDLRNLQDYVRGLRVVGGEE